LRSPLDSRSAPLQLHAALSLTAGHGSVLRRQGAYTIIQERCNSLRVTIPCSSHISTSVAESHLSTVTIVLSRPVHCICLRNGGTPLRRIGPRGSRRTARSHARHRGRCAIWVCGSGHVVACAKPPPHPGVRACSCSAVTSVARRSVPAVSSMCVQGADTTPRTQPLGAVRKPFLRPTRRAPCRVRCLFMLALRKLRASPERAPTPPGASLPPAHDERRSRLPPATCTLVMGRTS